MKFQDLTEQIPLRPSNQKGGDIDTWINDGVLVLPKFLSEEQISKYMSLREPVPLGGWNETPYLHYREIRDICLDNRLTTQMKRLVGEDMGLHLNLTGWVSTEREWHSDSYLNPEGVDDHYIAAWFALEDINPASGPFQYVKGSHRWPVLRRERIFAHLTPEQCRDSAWPTFTQKGVGAACQEEIECRGAEVVTYLPKRGDLLLWHPFLVHRGSLPQVPGTLRRALIAHYSGIHHRPDMAFVKDRRTQGYYARFEHPVQPGMPKSTNGILDGFGKRISRHSHWASHLIPRIARILKRVTSK